MIFERFFAKKDSNEKPTELLLPSDVRYALKYREAKMGLSELSDLNENGFERETLYLLLKCLANQPENQLNLLRQAVDVLIETQTEDLKSLQNFIRSTLKETATDVVVAGQKLSLLSRQGFSVWHELYRERSKIYAHDTENNVFMLGHSTLVGLGPFVKNFHQTGKTLQILIPNFMVDEELEICGYQIVAGEVLFLPKNFDRKRNSVVLDDVRNTGATIGEMTSFWTREGKFLPPRIDIILESSQTQDSSTASF